MGWRRLATRLVITPFILLALLGWLIPVQADEEAVVPGAGIGPLKLGLRIDDATQVFGRRFDRQDVQACNASYQWLFQQNDSLLVSGEEALLAAPKVSRQIGDLINVITISGSRGQHRTPGGVGLGSPVADVTTEFGSPSGEYPEGSGKWLSYEQRGIRFLVSESGNTVQAISVFWPLLKNVEMRPFDGIGPLSLGMEESRAIEVMGRQPDMVTSFGRLAWSLPVIPTYGRVSCAPYLAAWIESGKVRDIFTTASGFRTAKGVQVGDTVDALAKEFETPKSTTNTPETYFWVSTQGKPAKLIVGARPASEGTKQVVFFWIRAF